MTEKNANATKRCEVYLPWLYSFFEVIDNKSLNIAVHYRLHVSVLIARAVVLDKRIGTENVGAYLTTPLYLLYFALKLGIGRLALGNLTLYKLFSKLAVLCVPLPPKTTRQSNFSFL